MSTHTQSPTPSVELRRHQRQLASSELRALSRRALFGEASVTIAAVVAGLVYAGYLLLIDAPAKKFVFVGLLCIATVLLCFCLVLVRRYFLVRGRVFYAIADRSARWGSGPFEHLRLSTRIFTSPVRLFIGLLYGGTIAAAPFVLSGYTVRNEQWALAAFLFFANQLTGQTLYSLWVFLRSAEGLLRKVVVSIWIPANESTRFFLGLTTRLSVAATLYVALSMTSILFSQFALGPLVLGYMVFSICTIVVVVALPHTAVLRRLVDQKRNMLKSISGALDHNTRMVISGGDEDAVMTRTRNLMEVKKWVEDASYFPIRLSSVRAFVSVATISLLPVGLDWLLDRMVTGTLVLSP